MVRVAVLLVAALATEVSPVQKVIQLLDDLKGKVASDLQADSKLMDEYTEWCDEEANSKEDSITSSKRTISDLGATIADSKATILTLTSSIDELSMTVSTKEQELAKAKSIREEEHAVYTASEKELSETVDSLDRSTTVLKNNLGLVQGRVGTAMKAMAAGLSKVIEASWVNDHERGVVQSLLQTTDGDEQTPVAYSSSSGGIVDTLTEMKEKAEESLSSTRKDEMEAAHAYALLKQGIEDTVAVAKKQLEENTLIRSTTEEELHEAEASLAETQKVLATDTDYLAELKQSCEAKAVQWTARQKSAAEEMAAIEQAKTTLSEGVPSFLQTGVRVRRAAAATDEEDAIRDRVAKLLRGLARQQQNYVLSQIATRVRSDPFVKIRGLVEEMISKLVKEAAEEADQKAFCDEETSESKGKQADLTGKLEKVVARIEKAEASKAKLAEEIKHLSGEIAEIDAGQAKATMVRSEQHEEFLKASQDAKDSAAAVAKAIDVLSEYYSNGAPAFVQVGAGHHTWQPAFGGAKADVGSTIVSILENCESNFAQMLAEQEADEASALESYEKLTQDNKVAKAEKTADVKGKSNEISSLEVAVGNYKESKETTSEELDAVLTYLDKLKPQCETKALSYAERKAKRDAEIAGLKEALTLLSGDGFIQTSLRGARRI
jgi:uncharacterized protein (UPF0335 family)